MLQRSTGAPLDLSAAPVAPGPIERWKRPAVVGLLIAFAIGVAWWLVRTPVAQPIALPTPGGEATRPVKVHVTGAVARPGVYTLTASDRVQDAITQAGGPIEGGDTSRLNMASRLRDGQQVAVPGAAPVAVPPPSATTPSPRSVAAPPVAALSAASAPRTTRVPTARAQGRLNLNRATAAELEALPGIGASTANRIVQHRQQNGPFGAPDDLRRARLVTTRVWNQIKELVEAP